MNKFSVGHLVLLVMLTGCVAKHNFEPARLYYSRPAVIEFPGESVSVQLRRGQEGRLYLPARIGQREMLLLVDTGATMTLLDAQVVAAAGITMMAAPDGVLYGAGGNAKASVARIPLIDIQTVRITDCPVVVTDLELWNRREFAAQQIKIHGIVGSVLLQSLNARIDYASGAMRIEDVSRTQP